MYLWIALSAIDGKMSIGAMTMYVVVFKQGQSALSGALGDIGGMYEDNLYLSNLYEFLDTEVPPPGGAATEGPDPADGVRFDHVDVRLPGLRGAGAGRRLACTSRRGRSWRLSATTARARPR